MTYIYIREEKGFGQRRRHHRRRRKQSIRHDENGIERRERIRFQLKNKRATTNTFVVVPDREVASSGTSAKPSRPP